MLPDRRYAAIALATGLVLCARADAQQTGALRQMPMDTLGCLVRRGAVGVGTTGDTARGAARDSLVTQPQSTSAGRGPAIILRAAASAREVRFATQPQISVRLCGAVMDSVRVLERRNLPDPVQPGVTYRDVYIAVEILGHLNAECLAGRITGTVRGSVDCASLQVRDSAAGARRPPP